MVKIFSPTNPFTAIMDGQKMMNLFAPKYIKRVGMSICPPSSNWGCIILSAAKLAVD